MVLNVSRRAYQPTRNARPIALSAVGRMLASPMGTPFNDRRGNVLSALVADGKASKTEIRRFQEESRLGIEEYDTQQLRLTLESMGVFFCFIWSIGSVVGAYYMMQGEKTFSGLVNNFYDTGALETMTHAAGQYNSRKPQIEELLDAMKSLPEDFRTLNSTIHAAHDALIDIKAIAKHWCTEFGGPSCPET